MTNADNMFEELGYEKKGNNDYFEYSKLDTKVNELYVISFTAKTISCRLYTQGGRYGGFPLAIEPQELRAITKKCEELGWLEKEYSYELDYWDEKSREEKLNND